MIKIRWLIYTVLIGLLPFLIRVVFFFVSNTNKEFIMNETDFVIFGLVLNLTNLNELEHRKQSIWKTQMIGVSAIQIAFYAGILVMSYITEIDNQNIINNETLFYCALITSVVSFIFSYSIYDRLNKIKDDE